MSQTIELGSDPVGAHKRPVGRAAVRYHGLDSLRAAAMLAGVFYHLPVMSGTGLFGFAFGGSASPKAAIDEWLHSFRMPLFFLISGFFAAMMLGKYGFGRYWTRRVWRIGAPLLVAVLVFGAIRTYFPSVMQSFGGAFLMPAGGAPPAMPGWPMPGAGAGPSPFAPPGQPGMTPPPVFAPPVFAPPPTTTPAFPPFPGFPFPMFDMPTPPSRAIADRLFGTASRNFNLEHLWFLWYLLLFITLAPPVVWIINKALPMPLQESLDGLGRLILRFNLAALVLGIIALPPLMHARGFMGWSLTNPVGFLAPFPDFAFQYYADLPLYFTYFLAGWWLFRLRDRLADTSRGWAWSLVIGIAGFAGSRAMFDEYGMQANASGGSMIRIAGFAMYGIGAAYTAFGSLGFFQRFLSGPSKVGRYFADTALWVYLIHLPLIPLVIDWIEPSRCAWWQAAVAGMTLVTGISLALFELIVRPTPLMYLFGPPVKRGA